MINVSPVHQPFIYLEFQASHHESDDVSLDMVNKTVNIVSSTVQPFDPGSNRGDI